MSLLYPLGLLGLIGIPILIAIYIIKNKYTEQIIPTTYIWTVSERFLKKRLPIHRLVGIISLILQLLAVLFVSFAIAHPVFIIPNAARDYYFVLDGSGSMNIVQDDNTRLELAKNEIAKLINGSTDGSSYSLAVAGNPVEKVFEQVTEKKSAIKLLNAVSPQYIASELTGALAAAQSAFNENPSAEFYLVTDKAVASSENITVINVSDNAENYAVSELEFSPVALTVEGDVMSYSSDAELTVNLYVNGEDEIYDTRRLDVVKGEAAHFSFGLDAGDYRSLKAVIAEPDVLALDNESVFYNLEYEDRYSAVIVSDSPFFIQVALMSVGNADPLAVYPTAEYRKLAAASEIDLGFGLYIFDGYTPEVMPRDGAVWFFNPKSDVAESGFTVQDEIVFADAQKPEYTTDSSSVADSLLKNINYAQGEDIYVTKYQKCGTYRRFTSLLSIEGNPLVFTGSNTYGNREVVFAFDLHDSNFPVLPDFIVLVDNILTYSFPSVLNKSAYSCGETMEINVTANCDSIRVASPSGKISYMDTSQAVCEYDIKEVGVYTIKISFGETERTFNVFSSLAEKERNPLQAEEAFVIAGEPGNEKRAGTYGNMLYLFIILAVLCAADWMVYCYEQYQLR